MDSDFLTTNEAAAALNVSPQRVRVLIRSGRLKAKIVGEGNRATYLIAPADLEAVRHRKAGRPHKRIAPTRSKADTRKQKKKLSEANES